MKWSELLDNWSLSSLSLTTGFLNMEWQPNEKDKQCAWELGNPPKLKTPNK